MWVLSGQCVGTIEQWAVWFRLPPCSRAPRRRPLARGHRVPGTVTEAARCADRRRSGSSGSSPGSEPLLRNDDDDSSPASGVPRLGPTDTQRAQCIHADSRVVCSSRRAAGRGATGGGELPVRFPALGPLWHHVRMSSHRLCRRPRRGGAGPSPPWSADTPLDLSTKPVDSKSEYRVVKS